MEHIYLTNKNTDSANTIKQATKIEIRKLLSRIENCKNSKKIGNVILHSLI